MFGFKYCLILSMFYLLCQGIVRYLICFMKCFKTTVLGVSIVSLYKAPVSLTSVFKTCYSPELEIADFDRESFQYTWLNSYFFSSLQESNKTKHTKLLGTTR